MVKINVSQDCGNSPKNKLVQQLTIEHVVQGNKIKVDLEEPFKERAEAAKKKHEANQGQQQPASGEGK